MPIPTSPIEDLAAAAIGDDALAARWLDRPSPLFNGVSPAAALSTQEGRHRVRRQLAWFAGESFGNPPFSGDDWESLADLLSDPMMEIVLRRAGSGPEQLLGLYREIAAARRAA